MCYRKGLLIYYRNETFEPCFQGLWKVSSSDGLDFELDEAPRKLFESKLFQVRFNYTFMDDEYLLDDWRPDIKLSQPNMPYDLNKRTLGKLGYKHFEDK